MRIEKPGEALNLAELSNILTTAEAYTRAAADNILTLNVSSVSGQVIDLQSLVKQGFDQLNNTVSFSTTSTSYVDITGASLVFTKSRNDTNIILYAAVTAFNSLSSGAAEIVHSVDGSGNADAFKIIPSLANESTANMRISRKNGLSAGSHTIQLRVKSSTSNTASIQAVSITVIEVPA
jgi:hypothetical protein